MNGEQLGPDDTEKEKEPTSQELAEACREVLSDEDCEELAVMDFEDALGYAFTLLMENGIDDPESFLVEKGILEKTE